MKTDTLDKLIHNELKDVYDAEKRLTRALPKMAKAAESEELRAAIEEHLEVTKGHVSRLEEIFEAIGQKPAAKPCEGMKGVIQEGDEHVGEADKGALRDLIIIGAARRVEHYEMACYMNLIALCGELGDEKTLELLRQTLEEEQETDQKLEALGAELIGEVEGVETDEDEEEEEDEEDAEEVDTDEEEDEEDADKIETEEEPEPAHSGNRKR